jgi:hypothetical protein
MSFSRLLRKHSTPTLAPPAPTNAGSNHSADDPNGQPQRRQASEPTRTIPRPWRRKRPSTASHSSLSGQTTTSPTSISPRAEDLTPQGEVGEMPIPMPLPPDPNVFMTNLAMVPPPEMIEASSPVQDKLAEAWGAVKDDPGVAKPSRELDTAGVCSLARLFRGNLILASR